MNKQTIKTFGKIIEKDLKCSFENNFLKTQHKDSETPGKIYYNNLKHNYEIEQYLIVINRPEYRKAICQFRLGIHKLRINTGRYEKQGAPIPIEERICRFCNNGQLENITHFIMDCEKYSSLRKSFI